MTLSDHTDLVPSHAPAFATDQDTRRYYEQRAREYDDWYTGQGVFGSRERPGWTDEVREITRIVGRLAPCRTLDVACGTGFLTQHIRGFVVGLDQSPSMVAIAQSRIPERLALVGDALRLPFADASFDRVFTGHFYGHLPAEERTAFLTEASRVARELVVVDTARRAGVLPSERWEERVLNDGSRHRVYKRFLTGDELTAELGGDGAKLFDGRWFVAARSALH